VKRNHCVDRQASGTHQGQRHQPAEQGQRELVAALAVPEALREVDRQDGDEQVPGHEEGRDRCQQPDGDQEPTAEFDHSGYQRPRPARTDSDPLQAGCNAAQARTVEPTELLRSVRRYDQPQGESQDEQPSGHHGLLPPPVIPDRLSHWLSYGDLPWIG